MSPRNPVEGLQAWGHVNPDNPHFVVSEHSWYSHRDGAASSLREGHVLAKIQYHNGRWEVVKFYDDRPKVRVRVDPWKQWSIEGRGVWLESIAPEELKVKDDL